ncbi:MAG: cell surface receptor IPT/TIG domain-containing protein [Acidobacteria bacterium OLB17]|nr:MAG: cell surface receptor IPT/TIG domain-containing protein [Acidobacteria bacterium OLB17]MCZ2390448.1 hypothetical protein [Acidobacteriota bacterium]
MAARVMNDPNERKKLIAAIVLGALAIVALFYAFGRGIFASSPKPAASTQATPTPKPSPAAPGAFSLPTADEQAFNDTTTPVVMPANIPAPDPGRNIFAFYEPPKPTPYSPTPFVAPTPKPPTPTPTPAYELVGINPPTVYAGTNGIRLEVTGDRFEPTSHIYFNQTEFPTQFVSPQKLVANIPANLLTTEGSRQIIVQSPDGKKYSTQFMLTVQAPPKPAYTYLGMIGRKRFNNDTGYFMDTGRSDGKPFGLRINDVAGGRFRLIKLTPGEAMFEDTSLGFKHRIPIAQAADVPGGNQSFPIGQPRRGGYPQINQGYPNYTQQQPVQQQIDPANCPPGIPCNNLRPQRTPVNPPQNGDKGSKEDVDDNDQ